MDRLNVVFTGGGTGGHLYPAIAIAQALGERANVTFIGAADRLEATIVPNAGYPLITVKSAPAKRAYANLPGVFQAMSALRRLNPDIVIATGGYVSLPVVLAARILRQFRRIHTKIALLEPNARPGLTNRLLAPLVDEVWGAFPGGDPRFAGKYVQTGIPVRASLRTLPSRDAAIERLGLSSKRSTLLAMGGSQGARSINDALTSLLKSDGLARRLATDSRDRRKRVRPRTLSARKEDGALRAYLNDVGDAYAAADLVLARAGASTLGELAATGRPAILVPYPHAAEDHQRANAATVARSGAAVVVDDRDLIAGKLRGILAEVTQPSRLGDLRAAAERARTIDPITTILARVDALTARKNRT
jgi:UDP-N-acetylglucosamine--N-acetylmuramyl-(pentapeptide) pyrophosphoryl-undecaprenol N-acetylglucosamine transferase